MSLAHKDDPYMGNLNNLVWQQSEAKNIKIKSIAIPASIVCLSSFHYNTSVIMTIQWHKKNVSQAS